MSCIIAPRSWGSLYLHLIHCCRHQIDHCYLPVFATNNVTSMTNVHRGTDYPELINDPNKDFNVIANAVS